MTLLVGRVLLCLSTALAAGADGKDAQKKDTPKSERIEAAADAEMALVPAGPFIYGDDRGEPDERPARRVSLPAFAIDCTEVTVSAYSRCVAAGRCQAVRSPTGAAPADLGLPMVGVSYFDAARYCTFVNKRLPTEAEWEKAARGPEGRRYPWGDAFDCRRGNFGNFGGDGRCADQGAPGRPVAVGSFPDGASPYGVLDLSGNVWEWVDGRYGFAQLNRPGLRLLRGGGCCSIFGLSRSSDRLALPATYRDVDIGFRCARSMPSSDQGR